MVDNSEEISDISFEMAKWIHSTVPIDISDDRYMGLTDMVVLYIVCIDWC